MSIKHTSSYVEVNAEDACEVNDNKEKMQSPRMIFCRQLLYTSTIWTLFFLNGLHLGAPTVIIAQLRKNTEIDDNMASWITSTLSFGALPWIFILPTLSHFVGRRVTFMFVYVGAFIGFLILYLCVNITQLIIGEIILSIVLACVQTIAPIAINEYVSPKYRGIFMTIKSASTFWGIWVANAIGTFSNWKNIAIIAFLGNIYTLTVFIYPQSPYWLAENGKFTKCAKSHKWLKGTSIEAEKELDNLIRSYKRYREQRPNINSVFTRQYFNNMYKTVSYKGFYKPLLIAILLSIQYHLTGKLVCSMYAIELIKKITQDESTAYRGMLILDGITVFSVYCGCIISEFFKRRTYLLSTSAFAITFLYIFSLYLYLIYKSIIPENNFITILLLGLYSIAVGSGPMILLTSVCGELIPIRYQRPATVIIGITYDITMMTTIKSSLFLFKTLTLAGTFLIFAVSSSIIVVLLYLYLPETKNKTVSEIEDYFVESENNIDLLKMTSSNEPTPIIENR